MISVSHVTFLSQARALIDAFRHIPPGNKKAQRNTQLLLLKIAGGGEWRIKEAKNLTPTNNVSSTNPLQQWLLVHLSRPDN